jgi:hypothetical protein
MMDEGPTSAATMTIADENGARPGPRVPVRVSSRLTASVSVLLEQRMALIDELDTVRETCAELTRSLQRIGGTDDGSRMGGSPWGIDPRHQLAGTLSRIADLDRALDDLKRRANEAAP